MIGKAGLISKEILNDEYSGVQGCGGIPADKRMDAKLGEKFTAG